MKYEFVTVKGLWLWLPRSGDLFVRLSSDYCELLRDLLHLGSGSSLSSLSLSLSSGSMQGFGRW